MKVVDFERLTFSQKAKIVLKEGSFVSKASFHNLEISLYKLDDVFVEIWYEPFTETMKKIISLKKDSFMPFLKHLNFTTLN